MESRATQFMTAWNSWTASGTGGSTPTARLGKREADEDDFTVTDGYTDDYRNIDARGFLVNAANRAFRFGADLSRVCRLTLPRMKNTYGDRTSGPEASDSWYTHIEYDGDPGDPERIAPTEVVDRQMRKTLSWVAAVSDAKKMDNPEVVRLLQKGDARLRFSPYTPKTKAELAECKAMYNFIDAFSVGGSLYDNIDNNGDSIADERIPHRHGDYHYDILPDDLPELHPVRINKSANSDEESWLKEASNIWPAYGRINANTAPREVLEHCLIAPTAEARRKLGEAIWKERGGEASQDNDDYEPFRSLGELYARVSVRNGRSFGFDYYGFDGKDNHQGSAKLPDMGADIYGYRDDLDERNYLWRLNSESLTVRSDTFAAYLRIQARRQTDTGWEIVSERRIYSIWDRAECAWPPKRHDGRPHMDFSPPQRVGIQVFGY
jgi:hypothetical protein